MMSSQEQFPWRHVFCILESCGGDVEYTKVDSFDETQANFAFYDKHESGNWITKCIKCGHQTFVVGLKK